MNPADLSTFAVLAAELLRKPGEMMIYRYRDRLIIHA